MSTGTSVTLANRSSITAKYPVATILNESTTLKYDDPCGSVERGALEVEGILRRIQVSFPDKTGDSQDFDVKVLEDDDDDDGDEYEMWRNIGNS